MAKSTSDPKEIAAALIFLGCLLIGTAIGYVYNQLIVGGVVGMGVGLIGLAIIMVKKK